MYTKCSVYFFSNISAIKYLFCNLWCVSDMNSCAMNCIEVPIIAFRGESIRYTKHWLCIVTRVTPSQSYGEIPGFMAYLFRQLFLNRQNIFSWEDCLKENIFSFFMFHAYQWSEILPNINKCIEFQPELSLNMKHIFGNKQIDTLTFFYLMNNS